MATVSSSASARASLERSPRRLAGDDLALAYGAVPVVRGVSVELHPGRVTALVGPSGGGKSTLLRCINLLEQPTAGTVQIGDDTATFAPGKKAAWSSVLKLRGQTGMAFQNFQLFPHRTAIENVMEGLPVV